MVPFGWWRAARELLQLNSSHLTVFYNSDCPLCNRTVIILEHFDGFRALSFKALQTHARDHRALDGIPEQELLRDLYALDGNGRLYAGLDTYVQVFLAMRYTALLGLLIKTPGLYGMGQRVYRRIADNRTRISCDASCLPVREARGPEDELLGRFYRADPIAPRREAQRIAKLLILVFSLQFNSTVHYAVLDRIGWGVGSPAALVGRLSGALVLISTAFLGIVPHWLYVHDHFDGYNHLFAFTYRSANGDEKWLPFVNRQGRLIAPNWGRVQSMWANVAVRGNIDPRRFYKFTTKVTAYWGTRVGLNLDDAEITIKMKEIVMPTRWEPDLRKRNLSGPWQDIGRVVWKRRLARIEIPDVDLGSL
jgi:predicted DCC family thiol-disulfide oxidoreductase YuxK